MDVQRFGETHHWHVFRPHTNADGPFLKGRFIAIVSDPPLSKSTLPDIWSNMNGNIEETQNSQHQNGRFTVLTLSQVCVFNLN